MDPSWVLKQGIVWVPMVTSARGSPGEDPDGVDVDRRAKNPAGHEGAGDIC